MEIAERRPFREGEPREDRHIVINAPAAADHDNDRDGVEPVRHTHEARVNPYGMTATAPISCCHRLNFG